MEKNNEKVSKTRNGWKIEYLGAGDKWRTSSGFEYMSKSYALGAWAMLKAHYNHPWKYRLVNCGSVVEEMGRQLVKLS